MEKRNYKKPEFMEVKMERLCAYSVSGCIGTSDEP